MTNKIIAVGLIIWGLIILAASLIWMSPDQDDLVKRIAGAAIGAIMAIVGVSRLLSKNISKTTDKRIHFDDPEPRPVRAFEHAGADPAEDERPRRPAKPQDPELGAILGTYPEDPTHPTRVVVGKKGVRIIRKKETRNFLWSEIPLVRYWDDSYGIAIIFQTKDGTEHPVLAERKYGVEVGEVPVDAANALLEAIQWIREKVEPDLHIRRTPFSVKMGESGPIEAPFLIQSLGLISILFFWAPLIGLGIAAIALVLNWRIGGWGKVASWIGTVLTALAHLTCGGFVGYSAIFPNKKR